MDHRENEAPALGVGEGSEPAPGVLSQPRPRPLQGPRSMPAPSNAALVLDAFVQLVADAVAARLRAGQELAALPPPEASTWYDQNSAPIGRRAYLDACRRGDVVSRRIGKHVLVRRADLDAWIEAHRGSARSPAEPRPPDSREPSIDEILRAAGIVLRDPDGKGTPQKNRRAPRPVPKRRRST
jgi:hypothetical protein